MWSPRMGFLSRPKCGRLAAWTALALGWVLPMTGCQVEYAGMTLPSGKYMHDDVQYFAPGTSFPWANTQAATQRARMMQMGIEPGPVPGAGGAYNMPQSDLPPSQRAGGGTDINVDPREGDVPAPPKPPVPGGAPAPGGEPVPPPGGPTP